MESIPECPVKGCTAPVDLVLQSSNGDKFGAHKHNLQTFSDGFPLSNSVLGETATNDIPVLSETTEVLRLMLCFMHHAPQPDIQKLPFDTVAALADAAEKYFIFSAISLCKVYMSNKVKEHPVNVLGYACRNGYDDIAGQAAPLTLSVDADEVFESLGPEHTLRWFRYREGHLEHFRLIYSHVPGVAGLHKGGVKDCGLWAPFELEVLQRVLKIKNIADAQNARREIIREQMGRFQLKECSQCTRRAENWIQWSVNYNLGKSWAAFSPATGKLMAEEFVGWL